MLVEVKRSDHPAFLLNTDHIVTVQTYEFGIQIRLPDRGVLYLTTSVQIFKKALAEALRAPNNPIPVVEIP